MRNPANGLILLEFYRGWECKVHFYWFDESGKKKVIKAKVTLELKAS